jgi:2-polyprenyl-3-methyl-5-hydroxy-6-metoxy-1,4-benzoquinol methylase
MPQRLTLEPSSRQQPCDLCGQACFQVIDRRDRRHQPLTTVICRVCGLVSHEEIPDEPTLARYYESQYRADYHGEFAPAPHRVIRAWKGGEWLYRQLRPHVMAGSRVFEVGAGIGCTVKVFELAGFDAAGIDPGVGFQQFARQRLGARIARGNLYDLSSEPRYDFVLLVHVLEHFSSPRRALTHIHSLLHDRGRLYVECPNLGSPHSAPGKQFHFAHIHNFTPDTLEMLAGQCGFEVIGRLSAPRARALRLVLQRGERPGGTIDPGSYARTLEALRRYSPLGYHLRPSYLLDRIHRDLRFVSHHVLPAWRLRRLLDRCARHSTLSTDPAARGTERSTGEPASNHADSQTFGSDSAVRWASNRADTANICSASLAAPPRALARASSRQA